MTQLTNQKFEEFDEQTEKTVAEWFFLTIKPRFENKSDLVNNRRIFRAFDKITTKVEFNKYFNSITDTKIDIKPLCFIEYIKTLSKFIANDEQLNNYINQISFNYLKLLINNQYTIKNIPKSEFFVEPLSLMVKNLRENWKKLTNNNNIKELINELHQLIKMSNSSELMKCHNNIKSIECQIDKMVNNINSDLTIDEYYKKLNDLNKYAIENHKELIRISENHEKYLKNIQ